MIDQYFTEHSLKEDFVKSLGWTWDKNGTSITIPIYDEKGKLLFSRYRHLQGQNKFTQDKNTHPAIYCLHKIKNHETVIYAEGEPDTARLWQEQIPAVTGTSGVKTISPKLISQLKGKNIILCLDTDEAGQSSIEDYYNIFTAEDIPTTIKQLPPQVKDVCEYFSAGYTKEDFENLPTLTFDEWKDITTPEEYKLETAKDIISQKIPPDDWLVDRVIPAEGFTFIVGAEATGKSFYALSLAKAISTGTQWMDAHDNHDQQMFTVKSKEKVLIIDKENTKRRIQSRMKWFDINSDNIFFLKFPHYFELSDPSQDDGFSVIAKEASRQVKKNNIKFIIVDSFTDVMVGNENAASDVQGFFDAMRRLFPGTSTLVLHHVSKPVPGVFRTSAQRTRGSTNINAQVYSMFFVEALPKSRTEFVFEQTKAGDAQKLPKFIVELDVQENESSNKTQVKGILYKGIVPDEDMKIKEAVVEIENILKNTSQVSREDVVSVLQQKNISLSTVKRALKNMSDSGDIDSTPDPNNKRRKLYFLKDNNIVYE